MESSLNILVEARKEYLQQLSIVMCPVMIEVFEDIYKESVKVSKGKKVLIQYQKFLKEVGHWNDHMIHKHSETICNSCNWFNDLLAAVFVSSVKILSSVRINSNGNKISLKVPNNKVFIHGCFIAASKDLYKNPYIYHDESVEQERDTELALRFSKCIEETVKEMVPVQEILKSCMSQVNPEENIDFENTLEDDTEVMENEFDEDPEPEDGPEQEPEDGSNPEPEPGTETQPQPNEGNSEEMKNISVGKKQEGQEEEAEDDDGVLFKDAKE